MSRKNIVNWRAYGWRFWKPSPIRQRFLPGIGGELLAVREIEPGKYLVVVYRESQQDGFIITAFLTRKGQALRRRQQLWPLYLLRSICVCCRLSNKQVGGICGCRTMPRQTSCMSTSKNPVTPRTVNSRMMMSSSAMRAKRSLGLLFCTRVSGRAWGQGMSERYSEAAFE